MQTLTIEQLQKNATAAYASADAPTKKVLEALLNKKYLIPQKITERVKTFEDALAIVPPSENLKILLAYNGFDVVMRGAQAMAKLQVITTALNEGWKPDWTNSGEYKWYPYFKKSGSGLSFDGAVLWYTFTTVGSRLCFKSRELAEYAAEQFKDIYTEFMAL